MSGSSSDGAYAVLERLGAGGSGEVFLARDRRSGALVAVKRALPEDPEGARHLAEEFSRIASVSHPGIVRAVDFLPDPKDGGPCIVFDLARGQSSEQAARSASAAAILAWAAGLAETLHFLHNNGLLHGDLKPAHVFVDEQGVPRLIDFGLARTPGESGGGTPATAAPEILSGSPATVRSELYSLGATVFFWLFGRYPWGETLEQRLAAAERRPSLPRREDLAPGVLRLLRDLLAPHPGERPASAREVVDRLAEIGVGLPDPSFADPRTRAASLPLIGREEILGLLERVTGGADGVQARFLAVKGPRGSGRSRLLREAASMARLAGRRVEQIGTGPSPFSLSPRLPAALRIAADRGPLAVIIDTPRERGPVEEELLADLPRRLGGAEGLLVLVAAESEPGPGWEVIEPPPLSREQVADLIRRLLPGPPVSAHLASRLQVHAGGSPGRIVEILAEGVSRELITCGSGGWSLARFEQTPLGELEAGAAPAGGEQAARSRMGKDARVLFGALHAAEEAVDLRTLAGVADLSLTRAAAAARELMGQGRLERVTGGRLRQAGPRQPLPSRDPASRQSVHRRWLAELEKAPPRGRDAGVEKIVWLSRLSRHRARTGDLAGAARLAARAVRLALRHERADQGAGVLAGLPPRESFPPASRGMLARAAGEIHLARARPGEAAAAFEEAEAWLRAGLRRHDSQRAAIRLARCLGDLGEPDRGEELLETVAREASRPDIRAGALVELGILLARRQDYEGALSQLEQALRQASGSGVQARARAAQGRCLVLLGRLDEAERVLSLARQEAEAAGDRSLATTLLLAELQAARSGGHYYRLLDRAPMVEKALAERGEADGLGLLFALVAEASVATGELDRAAAAAERSVRWRQVHGHRGWLAAAWNRLARVQFLRGELPEARGAARAARREARTGHAEGELCEGRALSCRLEILSGHLPAARRLAHGALAAARRSGKPADAAEARLAMALVHRAEGDPGRAAEVARQLLESSAAEEKGEDLLLEARLLVAESRIVTDPPAAEHLAREVLARADGRGAFDLGVEALSVLERAQLAAGREQEAAASRRAAAARLDAAAGRLIGEAAARAFTERPDRFALRERWGLRNARRLDALYHIVADLNSLRDPAQVAEAMMDRTLAVLGAERGAVVVAQPGGELRLMLARGVEQQTAADALQLSRTVVDRARGGEPVLAIEPAEDPRFADAKSVRMFAIRAVLCVPLRSRGRLVGALYVDSRDPGRRFTRDDLRFLEALADHAALALENAQAFRRLEQENARLKADLGRRDRLGDLLGRSRPMAEVFRLLEAAAPSGLPVMVSGESGTGKDLVARTLHRLGPNPDGPFVTVNCAALPEPIFEATLFGHEKGAYTGADRERVGMLVQAHGGTLLLDEIAEMPASLQAKLLRVIEDKRVQPLGASEAQSVEFRVVAATNRDLSEAVREGAFRQDLLYRLDVLRIVLPPLRERLEDLPLLTAHLLEGLSGVFGPMRLSPAVLARLASWSWPGNVRELENTLSRLALHATEGIIDEECLAADPELAERFDMEAKGTHSHLETMEARAIRRALELTGGHRVRAARLLGIGRATLFRKIRRYHLEDAGRHPG